MNELESSVAIAIVAFVGFIYSAQERDLVPMMCTLAMFLISLLEIICCLSIE